MNNPRNIVIVLLAVAVVVLLVMVSHKPSNAGRDKAMIAFVQDSLADITGTWNPDALQKRADPAFTKAVKASGKNLNDFFKTLSTLGKAKTDVACNRLRYADITDASGHYATAYFACKATFEHGPAIIILQIKQDELKGPWRITLFRIDSPLFSPADKKKAAK